MIGLRLSLLLTIPAFAYLDPGTGSMLLYFIMGIVATFVYFVKDIFYKIKSVVMGGRADMDLRNLDGVDILFYSEGGHYWNLFLPIIEEFEKRNIKSAYYTSADDDPALKLNFEHLTSRYIGNYMSSFALLNHIKFKVVVMTTPQLDVMYLKRSRHVKRYVHLVHAPTDMLLYKKFAFDYFDAIMCSGEHQIKSIRALEEIRKLPKKVLYKTGLTYYDVMYRDRDRDLASKNDNTVLIAPTWGVNGMLSRYGAGFIEKLLQANYEVILRPHPQIYISQKELIGEIENRLSEYPNFTIDQNPSGEISMKRASIMISDISGIIFDFFFIYEKSIIAIEGDMQRGGFEAEDVDMEIWESKILERVATLVKDDDIDKLADIVSNLINKDIVKNVKELREESLFNFPHSATIAADQILKMVKEVKS